MVGVEVMAEVGSGPQFEGRRGQVCVSRSR